MNLNEKAEIAKLMKTLNITEAEAKDVYECDKAIDKGENLFSLDPELEAGAKKARRAERKANSTPVKRERKADNLKAEIIQNLVSALENSGSFEAANFQVQNAEREFTFSVDGRKFKIVLSCPRS